MSNLMRAVQLLEAADKSVIAITPSHVLCKLQDTKYVIWRWYVDPDNDAECNLVYGHYLTSGQEEALEVFHSLMLG